jgi:hypothetical protein
LSAVFAQEQHAKLLNFITVGLLAKATDSVFLIVKHVAGPYVLQFVTVVNVVILEPLLITLN